MFDDLYNADILALTATLENGRLEAPTASVRKVSKLCGSWLELDVIMTDGVVQEAALRVQACALGQASAAILKNNIIGATPDEISEARNALYAMLKEEGLPPEGRFADLRLLVGVKAYPARHTSVMLAFDAAAEATGN